MHKKSSKHRDESFIGRSKGIGGLDKDDAKEFLKKSSKRKKSMFAKGKD